MGEALQFSQQFKELEPVDVLVCGAGPAGLMAAVTLARYRVSLKIIDKRFQKIMVGHASGLYISHLVRSYSGTHLFCEDRDIFFILYP